MNKSIDLKLVQESANTLTSDELLVLKKMARAYRSIGWVLSGLIAVSGGALAVYDLAHNITLEALK